jgi:hypothetical protein
MKKKTQAENILSHMKRVGFITSITALNEYGCFRLAAVIHILRKEHTIKTHRTQANWAVYTLEGRFLEEQYDVLDEV